MIPIRCNTARLHSASAITDRFLLLRDLHIFLCCFLYFRQFCHSAHFPVRYVFLELLPQFFRAVEYKAVCFLHPAAFILLCNFFLQPLPAGASCYRAKPLFNRLVFKNCGSLHLPMIDADRAQAVLIKNLYLDHIHFKVLLHRHLWDFNAKVQRPPNKILAMIASPPSATPAVATLAVATLAPYFFQFFNSLFRFLPWIKGCPNHPCTFCPSFL